MMIPAGKAGLVIGKGGETIKQLQVNLMFFASAFLEVSMTQPEKINQSWLDQIWTFFWKSVFSH